MNIIYNCDDGFLIAGLRKLNELINGIRNIHDINTAQ